MSEIRLRIGKNLVVLDIRERLTFISGDSGIGKTLMVDMMYDIMKNPDASEITGLDPHKIVVCKNEDSLSLIFGRDRCLIVLDRFDIYSQDSKDLVQREIEKENNTWLIVTDKPSFKFSRNVGVSFSSFRTLKVTQTLTGNIIELVRR